MFIIDFDLKMTKFSERFRAMADFILRIGPRGLPVLTNGDSYHPLALGLRPTNPPKKNNHKNQSELGKNIVGNLLELKVFTSKRSEAGKRTGVTSRGWLEFSDQSNGKAK